MAPFDIKEARDRFPALKQEQIYLDNAGGSQVLGDVITSMTNYLSKTNVQLGASYHTGRLSNTKYEAGYQAAAKYMNAERSEIVLGASTTQLFMNLASSLNLLPNSEIILSKVEHETNVKPWLYLAQRHNLTVKWWTPGPDSPHDRKLTPQSLTPLLTPKTSLVACTHVSNILGGIHDISAIAATVHDAGALFIVDGVSFAPHRQVDVKALGADFYAFSWYKVYGPHIAVLYASTAAQTHMQPRNHYFNPTQTLEDKLDFAASSYEAVQTLPVIVEYLAGAWEGAARHEAVLAGILLEFLMSRSDVTVHGSTSSDPGVRVPTISFTVEGVDSRSLVEKVDEISNIGIRWGHFYSKRLCDEVLGIAPEGVVRVSMVHYNTEEEIRKVVEVLERVMP